MDNIRIRWAEITPEGFKAELITSRMSHVYIETVHLEIRLYDANRNRLNKLLCEIIRDEMEAAKIRHSPGEGLK